MCRLVRSQLCISPTCHTAFCAQVYQPPTETVLFYLSPAPRASLSLHLVASYSRATQNRYSAQERFSSRFSLTPTRFGLMLLNKLRFPLFPKYRLPIRMIPQPSLWRRSYAIHGSPRLPDSLLSFLCSTFSSNAELSPRTCMHAQPSTLN